MINRKYKKILPLIFIPIAAAILILLAVLLPKSYSADVPANITIEGGAEVTVYVGGHNVKKSGDAYSAPAGDYVTVTAVNETKLFVSMTINDTVYTSPIVRIAVPDGGLVIKDIKTAEPYAEDHGKYFGNPYMISNEDDILALERIFRGKGTAADFEAFGEKNDADSLLRLQYGYYRIKTNLFVVDENFGGLGSREIPFHGCMDFSDFNVTINITRTSHRNEDFVYVPQTDANIADYGFFSYIYGDGVSPCLLRNIDVRGTVSINTLDGGDSDSADRVNAGGIAGTAGKNIVFDGIISQVSVSTQLKKASLYIGGLFGYCSSSVDTWCLSEYEGYHSNVSGITWGENADVYAGGFAGITENAYINDFVFDMTSTTVLSNSVGKLSGLAVSGGLTGAFTVNEAKLPETSEPKTTAAKNITIYLKGDLSVVSVVNNSDFTDISSLVGENMVSESAAVSGGIIGIIYRNKSLADDINIYFSDMSVKVHPDFIAKEADRMYIRAQTLDGNSVGMTFAGGLVGYIHTDSTEKFHYVSEGIDENGIIPHIFECNLDVSAVQNGIGSAYAGGYFGYNAFRLPDVGSDGKTFVYRLCSGDFGFNVSAVQTTTSRKEKTSSYDTNLFRVCAGGYTSQLPYGYNVQNKKYILGNCNIRAYREVGSTAIGSIAAGGYAGIAAGKTPDLATDASKQLAGVLKNMTLIFEGNTYIEAGCHSFDSDYNYNPNAGMISKRGYGNNVYSGGLIGLIIGYSEIENIHVDHSRNASALIKENALVSGIQNAVTGHGDLKSEGFVGGIFGMTMDCEIKNVEFSGSPERKTLIYFESANSPDTASVGGGIGGVWSWWRGNIAMVDGLSVSNAHVVGKAYCEKNTNDNRYDVYVGGGVGIFGNDSASGTSNNGNTIKHIYVRDTVVDAVGEDRMLTYAAGIVGGVWWKYSFYVTDCVVRGCSVTASSVSHKAYAGGIAGIVQANDRNQRSYVSDCIVVDTEISAISNGDETSAAGIFAWGKTNFGITGCYSNATIKSSGANASKSFFAGIGHPPWKDGNGILQNNFFVTKTAGTDAVYLNAGRYQNVSGAPIYLISYGTDEAEINTGGYVSIYPKISTANTSIKIKSSDESILKISTVDGSYIATGVSEGIANASLWVVANDGTEYRLCSYPIKVGAPSLSDFETELKNENGDLLSEANTDGFYAHYEKSATEHYSYIKRCVGNPATSKYVRIFPAGTDENGNAYENFPVRMKLYEVSAGSIPKASDITERTKAIIAAKGESISYSAFNGRLTFSAETSGAHDISYTINAWDTLEEPVIMIAEFTVGDRTEGVIIEYEPNYITGITITPNEMTPPLDTEIINGKLYFIYAPGDTVRFDAAVHRKYPIYSSYVVETEFSGTKAGGADTDIVKPNGSLVISGKKSEYDIICTVIGSDIKDTAYIAVRDPVEYSFELSGADVSADRKMAAGSEFTFAISPQIGYGLIPEIGFTVGGEKADVVWDGKSTSVQISWGGKIYTANAEPATDAEYEYTLDLPGDFIAAINEAGKDITIHVTYQKTYYVIFLSNFGTNEVYMMEVPVGTLLSDIDSAEFEKWKNDISAMRYGFIFRDMYMTSHAESMRAYGKSFTELSDSSYRVSGSLRFYARWTYSITTETPQNIAVSSGFSSELYQNVIVPIDTAHGFSFRISSDSTWAGTPEYDVYIRKADGTKINITSAFSADANGNGYVINKNALDEYTTDSGCIHVVVYADNMRFFVGDTVEFQTEKLLSDGVFGVEYSVNYGNKTAAPADIVFDFAHSLPAGTSLRIYYRRDGKTVWSGGYVTETNTPDIDIRIFASMADGTALSNDIRIGAEYETFILQVTLPNNKINYSFGTREYLASCISMKKRSTFSPVIISRGISHDSIYAQGEPTKKNFDIYPATLHTVLKSGNILTYSVYVNAPDITDYRHRGSSYLWKIEKISGPAETDLEDLAGKTPVASSTIARFYLAEEESIDIGGLPVGYTVSLVEVRNAKQPGEGLVLYSFATGG